MISTSLFASRTVRRGLGDHRGGTILVIVPTIPRVPLLAAVDLQRPHRRVGQVSPVARHSEALGSGGVCGRPAGRSPRTSAGIEIAATVPGCVHTDLLRAGLIPDPYLDDNESALAWIGLVDWEYSRSSPSHPRRQPDATTSSSKASTRSRRSDWMASCSPTSPTSTAPYRFDVSRLLTPGGSRAHGRLPEPGALRHRAEHAARSPATAVSAAVRGDPKVGLQLRLGLGESPPSRAASGDPSRGSAGRRHAGTRCGSSPLRWEAAARVAVTGSIVSRLRRASHGRRRGGRPPR